MGKSEVVMPLMTFRQINDGQYDVEVNLNKTGINITEDILNEINKGVRQKIVTCSGNRLKYRSETLLPNKIDKKKTKVLFILGNPAIHSIENKMFFFSKRDDVSRHVFWGKLAKICLLENFGLETRGQEAEARRKLILTGNTNHRFVIGLTTFYSMPTPTGIQGNKYCDSRGVEKFFNSISLLDKIKEEEFNRITAYPFAKDAIWITKIKSACEYLSDRVNNDRVKYWPIRGKGSGWKDLRKILDEI